MTDEHYALATFLHLARASELRRRWLVRDKLLLVCAARAHELELPRLAAHCRARILSHNPGHLLGRFATVAEAAKDERFTALRWQADRAYSGEKAEYMLQSLGIELGRAEATYGDAEEYLESILGPPPLMEGDTAQPELNVEGASELSDALLPDRESTDVASEWPALAVRRYSDAEVAARSRRELRLLWGGIATLSIAILAWGAFLIRR